MRLALLFALIAGLSAQEAPNANRFDYDGSASLDIRETGVEKRGSVTIHDISYASPKGGRVPAYLVVPKGKGPFAAVMWGHWYWATSEFANRKQFLDEAIVLADLGVVSLLTSGPIARPEYAAPKNPFSEEAAEHLVQQVIDLRRGADLLLARKDVDPKRLAYVGHSYNATAGGILSGVDKRFTAFVLMAGPLSHQVDFGTKTYQEIRAKVGPERFDALTSKYSFLDPARYVSKAAPATVLLQYATVERFITPEIAEQYAEIVSEPKEFKIYEAPHALNAAARRDRVAFLVKQFNLRHVSLKALAKVPDLPQPEK